MKTCVQTLLCLLVVTASLGQGKIYNIVDVQPEYPGGVVKFYQFIGKNLKYPESLPRPCIKGKLFIIFVVEKNGIARLERCENGCPEIFLQIKKMFKKMPRWKPAKHKGKKIRCLYTLPVNIENE